MQIETGTDELLCEIRERVATVTLNRPHKKNSLSDQLTPALRQLLLTLEAEPDVGCVMLTGAGDAFCSGGDVGGMGGGGRAAEGAQTTAGASAATADRRAPSLDDRVADLIRRQESLTLRLYELSKPTLAALPGPAAGAGLSIALACDLRVARADAFIVTAFAQIGLSGDYGASWFLNRLLGQGKTKELMFLSERIGADECARLGLVNAVFARETFRDEAFAYAKRIADGPTMALSRMKRNINRGAMQGLRESLALEAEHMVMSFTSEEARERIRVFGNKSRTTKEDAG